MRLYCNLLTLWYSLTSPQFYRTGWAIKGHDYLEVFNDGNIQVLKCQRCKDESAAWNEKILPKPNSKELDNET